MIRRKRSTRRSVQTRTIHPELGWLEQLLDLTAGRAQAKAMDGNEVHFTQPVVALGKLFVVDHAGHLWAFGSSISPPA